MSRDFVSVTEGLQKLGRDFVSITEGLQKLSIIKEIIIVRDDYIPFVCPVCHKTRAEEYLRIYMVGSPNACCIHSRCLMSICLSVGLVNASTDRGIDEYKGQNIFRRAEEEKAAEGGGKE